MADSIKRLISLWAIHAKLDLLWLIRDTKNCVLNIIADLTSSLSTILGIFLLSQRFDNIGGMSSDHILFMLGYACLVDGIFLMFFMMNNTGFLSRIIGRGQLDHKLIQPNPLWMQLITEGFIPFSGSSMFICGLGITIYSSMRLGLSFSIFQLIILVLSIVCSIIVILSFSCIFSCIAFYAPVAGEEVSTSAYGLFDQLKGFPLGGFTIYLQALFTTVLPIGMAAWYPASLLLGNELKLPNYLMIVVTLSLAIIAITLFKKGLKYYGEKGSIRYSSRGFRN